MNKAWYFLIVAILLNPLLVFTHAVEPAETTTTAAINDMPLSYGKGYRYNARGWIYVHIEGAPYDRGFQYGYLVAHEIADQIMRWSNDIHNSPALSAITLDHNSSLYEKISNTWWNFVRRQTHRIFWDRFPEEYQQEIKGIADGVNKRGATIHGRELDYKDILASNEMYEFMQRFTHPVKGFHPLKSLFGLLRDLVPTGLGTEKEFIAGFLGAERAHHCNGFIATGDATTNGQIVVSHGIRCGGWWYSYYVAQRWNVVTDVVPSEGYRFQMSSAPGYIWSDHNYYQNEKGLVVLDTTCAQGPWTNRGYPMSIRMRMTAQYTSSVDEALEKLREKNDGVWPAAYLVGDTKTGEIARMDLGWQKYEVWRTSNGFYWSANNAMSTAVRGEALGLGLKGELLGIIERLLGIRMYYEYYTRRYIPAPRDLKLEEMGEKYYGDIDVEVLKNKIMMAYPICDEASTDVKVADSSLIENNSLWAFWGNIRGMVWNTSALKPNLAGARDVPPAGYTLLGGLPENHGVELPSSSSKPVVGNSDIKWKFDFADEFEGRNAWDANLVTNDEVLFAAASDGNVYALDVETGDLRWKTKVNDFDNDTWINANDEVVVVGWENNTCALNVDNGEVVWKNVDVQFVCSNPVIHGDQVIIGTRNGALYSLDLNDGDTNWHVVLGDQKVYPSVSENPKKSGIAVATGKKCSMINAQDGSVVWSVPTNGIIRAPPRYEGDTVYVGSSDTCVYSIKSKTGFVNWKHKTGWAIVSTPMVRNDCVFVTSLDHHLYVLDTSQGDILWSFMGNAAIHSSPMVYGDFVFFGCDDGRFYAVNISTHELGWSFAPAYTIDDHIYNYITTSIVRDPVAVNGTVFMSGNGMVYALDAQTYEYPSLQQQKKTFAIPPTLLLTIGVIVSLLIILIGVYVYLRRKK